MNTPSTCLQPLQPRYSQPNPLNPLPRNWLPQPPQGPRETRGPQLLTLPGPPSAPRPDSSTPSSSSTFARSLHHALTWSFLATGQGKVCEISCHLGRKVPRPQHACAHLLACL